MDDQLFQLKFVAKQLDRSASKCEKAERDEAQRAKQALIKGNREGARIHVENSVRNKNQALAIRKMLSRVDAVCSRVQMAISYRTLTNNMAGVVKSMEKAAQLMDLVKMSKIMDSFEKNFENLDVQAMVMDNTIGNTVALSVPDEQVENLMSKIADEAGLELSSDLPKAASSVVSVSATEEDELTKRLARLRQT